MIPHVLKARSVHLLVGLLFTLVVNLPAQTADVERQGSALTQTVVCPGFWTQVSSSGPSPRGGHDHDLAWVPRSEAHPELKSAVPHTRAALTPNRVVPAFISPYVRAESEDGRSDNIPVAHRLRRWDGSRGLRMSGTSN